MMPSNRNPILKTMTAPTSKQHQMIALLKQLAPHEGYTQSLLDDVRFMRANRPL